MAADLQTAEAVFSHRLSIDPRHEFFRKGASVEGSGGCEGRRHSLFLRLEEKVQHLVGQSSTEFNTLVNDCYRDIAELQCLRLDV